MREIKFRAWDKNNEFMNYADGGCFLLEDNGWRLGSPDYDWVVRGQCSECGDILMQYTGLKDRNRVEIYDGDVIVYEWAMGGEQFVIEFCDGCFRLKGYCSSYQSFWDISHESCKVIGNIYQNPELLDKEEG